MKKLVILDFFKISSNKDDRNISDRKKFIIRFNKNTNIEHLSRSKLNDNDNLHV